jgi:TonB family protein
MSGESELRSFYIKMFFSTLLRSSLIAQRSSLLRVGVLLALLIFSVRPVISAAQERVLGPVVSSYLLGLAEEMSELDFLVRRGEITQSSYQRSRQRLLLTRRYVERAAGESGEDSVPVLQVLASDELTALGVTPLPSDLNPGATFGERWKLIAIETTTPRFYIFEGVRPKAAANRIDPRTAIETIVVEEKFYTPPEPVPEPAAPPVTAAAEPPHAAPKEAPPSGPPFTVPRILKFYLPTYSSEARTKGIEGEVVVSALLRRDGKIKDIIIAQSLGHGLDERAREAVRRIEFESAQLAGQPVDARTLIAFNFKLLRITVQVRSAEPVDQGRTTRQ